MTEPIGDHDVANLTVHKTVSVIPQAVTPLTGATVSALGSLLLLTPAGTLATLTIAFPSAQNGQYFTILTTAIVTALTVTNATISGGSPTALAANTSYKYVYFNSVWYRN